MAKPARELPQLHSMSGIPGRRRRHSPDGSVNATTVAQHLDLSHHRIAQLVEEAVLQKLPNGRFDTNDCRVRYIRWLRDPERRSAKSKADQEFTQAKADLIKIRIAEKQRDLIPCVEAEEVGEKMISIVITKLGGLAARIGGSMDDRRKVDRVVFEVRTEMADAFTEMANKAEAEVAEEAEAKPPSAEADTVEQTTG
jgi:hypothetical protein